MLFCRCGIAGLTCIDWCYLHLLLETISLNNLCFWIQYSIILKITGFLFLKGELPFSWGKKKCNITYSGKIRHWELFSCPSLPNVFSWSQFNFVSLPPAQVCTAAQNTRDHVGETYITSLAQRAFPMGLLQPDFFTTCLFLWGQKDRSWIHTCPIAIKILLSPRTPRNYYLCLSLSQA